MVETGRGSQTEAAAERTVRIAIVAAVPQEVAPLEAALQSPTSLRIGRKPAREGLLEGNAVTVMAGGMGKTNAAQAITALLERQPVRGILNIGIAGAYPESGLELGAVALASEEIYGDEGVLSPTGWLSTEVIGIPLLETAAARLYNRFPLDAALVERARLLLDRGGFAAATGPFVTMSCCSGTGTRGAEIGARFGALCESMEGAALAHVCSLYEVPFLEIRAISNLVEDRDLSRWSLREALQAACRAARSVLPAF